MVLHALKIIGFILVLVLAGVVYFSYDLMQQTEASVMADESYLQQQLPLLSKAQWYSKTVSQRDRITALGAVKTVVNQQVVLQGLEGETYYRGYRVLVQFDQLHCLNVRLNYPNKAPELVRVELTNLGPDQCVQ